MRKTLLVILDGWGHSDFEGAPDPGNAIELAHVPTFRRLFEQRPRTRLACSGADVGLPDGQMGNSEVGHLNLGAGRVVYQDIARVDAAIADGSFASQLGLGELVHDLEVSGGALHLVGLVSDGGVHSHLRHLEALFAEIPTTCVVHVHCITDGRDTSPTAGAGYLGSVEALCGRSDRWGIASVIGRYWAMDRDRRWDRTQRAFELLAGGKAEAWADDVGFVETCYAEGVTDEFVILFNFRADRMRQLAAALARPDFDAFVRAGELPARVVTMTEYEDTLPVSVAFPPQNVRDGLSEYLASCGHSQLKVAETEKYAHVTYFFNGGEETPWQGEERDLVPSPKVATYDLQPEMSARGVADAVLRGIASGVDFILVNFANPDMVGHTGSIPAAVEAVEAVDACLADLLEAVDADPRYVALITADHGNCEQMIDAAGNVHTAHTTEPVDLIVYDPQRANGSPTPSLAPEGRLADVAPTVLGYMGLEPPDAMSGVDLVLERASGSAP
jgi:2,3-bisphosphoglycerate-independent phosphoglycerate mutase